MIYFLQSAPGLPIKIGKAKRLTNRLSTVRSDYIHYPGSPWPQDERVVQLKPIGVMPGDFAEETTLHRRFVHLRIRDVFNVFGSNSREWFSPSDELLDFIATHTRPWDRYSEELAEWLEIPINLRHLDPIVIRAERKAAIRQQRLAERLARKEASAKRRAERNAIAKARSPIRFQHPVIPISDAARKLKLDRAALMDLTKICGIAVRTDGDTLGFRREDVLRVRWILRSSG